MKSVRDAILPVANSLWDFLLKIQRIVMLVSIAFTTTAIMIEVVMRYVFQSSIVGIQELAAYCALWLYFSGAAYGTYSRSHITADLTHMFLRNPRHLAILKLATNFISFALALYIVPWAWRYFEWGITKHEQSSSTFMGHTYDVVFFQTSILYGIVLMAFYFGVETIIWLRAILNSQEIPQELDFVREEPRTWI